MAFRFQDLQHIPRSVLERLEVCPTALAGTVQTWCIWDPLDEKRAEDARQTLRPYLPDAQLEFVQAIQTPDMEPQEWFRRLLDSVYRPPVESTEREPCTSCGDRTRSRVRGKMTTLCADCLTLAAAAPARTGDCAMCSVRQQTVHAVNSVLVCDNCLKLSGEILEK